MLLVPEQYQTVEEIEIAKAYYNAYIWTYWKYKQLGYPSSFKYNIHCYTAGEPFVACLVKDKFNTYLLWCNNARCEE